MRPSLRVIPLENGPNKKNQQRVEDGLRQRLKNSITGANIYSHIDWELSKTTRRARLTVFYLKRAEFTATEGRRGLDTWSHLKTLVPEGKNSLSGYRSCTEHVVYCTQGKYTAERREMAAIVGYWIVDVNAEIGVSRDEWTVPRCFRS
ncbi:hypothetical protein Tco_1236735 [Tanacetum coccineum]